jgi:glycosyltransferase involved in cell wall biosynthesis
MKVAIIVDFLIEENGGAQKVVEELLRIYPQSDIYTTTFASHKFSSGSIFTRYNQNNKIFTGLSDKILSKVSNLNKNISYYHFFWLYFIDSFFRKVENYDLVIVSLCANAKLFRIKNCGKTLVYCHAPTRYFYPELMNKDDYRYLKLAERWILGIIKFFLLPLENLGNKRIREVEKSFWACNSTFIRSLVSKYIKVDSIVINPPINIANYSDINRNPQDFYLYHGRLTMQKRLDIAIKACIKSGRRLKISGKATLPSINESLKKIAGNSSLIEFLGPTTNEQLKGLMSRCKALIFTPKEDFGIVPIEAVSAGVPVIAYKAGGALDYIKDGINGMFFEKQEEDSLIETLEKFEKQTFDTQKIKSSLKDFSATRFGQEIVTYIEKN